MDKAELAGYLVTHVGCDITTAEEFVLGQWSPPSEPSLSVQYYRRHKAKLLAGQLKDLKEFTEAWEIMLKGLLEEEAALGRCFLVFEGYARAYLNDPELGHRIIIEAFNSLRGMS